MQCIPHRPNRAMQCIPHRPNRAMQCIPHRPNRAFDSLSCDSSVQLLSAVFDEVQSWMASNKLLLNPSKTEFLLLGTPQQLKKFDWLKSLKLGDSIVAPADAARNLGVVLNSTMSLTGHVYNSICISHTICSFVTYAELGVMYPCVQEFLWQMHWFPVA